MNKDDLYEYGDKLVTRDEAKKIIDSKVKELENNPPALGEGKDGVDRWTNNGHGIVVGKSSITKAEAEAIEKAADNQQGHIRKVTYVEPASYFNEDMRKAIDEWEKEHKQ